MLNINLVLNDKKKTQDKDKREKEELTCTTETSEIADPVSDGGCDDLELGFEEYADGEAERTLRTYKSHHIPRKRKFDHHKPKRMQFAKLYRNHRPCLLIHNGP